MSKWGKVILLLLALPIFMTNYHIGELKADSNHSENDGIYASHTPIQALQEPAENDSIPVISVPNAEFEFGINITVSFGMYDEPNFIAGYNYGLYMINGHMINVSAYDLETESVKLLTFGTTETNMSVFDVKTISQSQSGSSILISPGEYTILFQVNSTNRGRLNETVEIVVKNTLAPIIGVQFIVNGPNPITKYPTTVNETSTVTVLIKNTGFSDAFDITINRGAINEPFGLGNISFPILYSSLTVNESRSFTFTTNPSKWGIGKLQLQVDFFDANATPLFSTWDFTVNVLPQITGIIQVETVDGKIDIDNTVNATVLISYYGPKLSNDIFITFRVESETITFLPIIGQPFSQNTTEYYFTGTPIQIGSSGISLIIEFYDKDGGDLETRTADTRSVEIVERIILEDNGSNPLLASILILYTVIMIIVIIFYFRQDVRNQFFSRILGVEFINPLKFPSSSVIIDGSNVAWEEYSINKKAKLANINLAIKTLKAAGIEDIIIIADASLRYQIDEKDELDKLVAQGIIKLTPAKVDADGLILRLAADTGSLILSNDLYKQHRAEYTWIDSRRIPYTIINSKIYLHPIFEKKTSTKK